MDPSQASVENLVEWSGAPFWHKHAPQANNNDNNNNDK